MQSYDCRWRTGTGDEASFICFDVRMKKTDIQKRCQRKNGSTTHHHQPNGIQLAIPTQWNHRFGAKINSKIKNLIAKKVTHRTSHIALTQIPTYKYRYEHNVVLPKSIHQKTSSSCNHFIPFHKTRSLFPSSKSWVFAAHY